MFIRISMRPPSAPGPVPPPPASPSPEYGTGVKSPLKSANRRPDGKGWTPGMAARGESRQDVELSRPQTAGERSAKHRFRRGAAGIDKGAAVAPLSRSRAVQVTYFPVLKVNGKARKSYIYDITLRDLPPHPAAPSRRCSAASQCSPESAYGHRAHPDRSGIRWTR